MKELSYKDTEREIELKIYGLNFKINNKIEKLNIDEIKEKAESDDKVIEKAIEEILGDGAIQKINEQRIKDGYKEMNLDVQTQVFNFIIKTYMDVVLAPVNETMNYMENYGRKHKNNRYNKNRYRRY